MRHMAKRALSLLLALLLCLTLFPAAALAEEGSICPVEDGEDAGLTGTPAPTEENEPGTNVGDGVLDVPADDPAALPQEPAADEIQGIVASGTCGENLTWTLDEAGLLTISGEGAMKNWTYESELPWRDQIESIQTIQIEAGVTSIGSAAFIGCSSMTSITVSGSLTGIRRFAFSGCSSMTGITVLGNVTSIGEYAFEKCGSLTDVTIMGEVTSVGSYAFYGLNSLKQVSILEGPASIGDYAFSDCSSLTSLSIPEGVAGIGKDAFRNCSSLSHITISGDAVSIPNSAFRNCSSLMSVIIQDGVTSIGANAFYGCSSLASVTIPGSVTSIGEGAFYNCTSLTSAEILPGVTDIGKSAFYNCSSLTSVTIPASVTDIGEDAFLGCNAVEKVFINDLDWWLEPPNSSSTGLPHGDLYLNGEPVTEIAIPRGTPSLRPSMFSKMKSLQSVTIPAGLDTIGNAAFCYCSSLREVTFPESLTTIGSNAFSGCSSLTSLTIPAGVNSIGANAFSGCGSLREILVEEGNDGYASVEGVLYNADLQKLIQCPGGKSGALTIPASVTSIGSYAFNSCSSLTSVTIPAGVTEIYSATFTWCSSLKEILVAEGNQNYVSLDGVVYKTGFRMLFLCPGGKTGALTIPDGVIRIGDSAFYGCSSIESVTVPSSVISLEDYAFCSCSLKYILFLGDVPEINTAVFRNDRLTAVYPVENATWTSDKLKEYDAEAMTWAGYRGEAKAYTIHFDPNGGSNAPEDQIKGHNVNIQLSQDVPSHEKGTFLGWSTRADATEPVYLPGRSFSRNADTTLYAVWEVVPTVVASGSCGENLTWTLDDTGLLTISGTGAMTDWGYGASPWYSHRDNIKEILMEDGVTGIGINAFCNCSSLTYVTIPTSVTDIGESAFSYCSGLTSVTIPKGVPIIKSSTYTGCSSLMSVTIPNSVIRIESSAFKDCSSLTGVTIPQSVTGIESFAFSGCSSLTSVTIPDSVTTIASHAFTECTSLTTVTLPESITRIADTLFRGCTGLMSVTIPESVTYVGDSSFQDCSSLRIVLFQGDVPTIRNAFSNDSTTAVYPIDNATWISDKLQNYGAEKLTWVGYRDEAKAYTIHFDPNGGSGAPEDQIKGHNVDITLTDAVPSRENATFLGWSTRSEATKPEHLPGDSFGLNADTILFAVWKLESQVLPTEAVLTLSSAKVCAGQEFTVELTMEKNPGLMYLSFRLDYDADALEFLGAEDGFFTGWTVNKEKSFLAWDADEDRTENGALLRLRFRAKEEAPTGETAVALADLFATNYAENLLGIGTVPGTVTVLPHLPGDTNGDGDVDGRDLVRLRKHLAGVPEGEILDANADVNADRKVNIMDLILLRRYLAQEDVILE